MEPTGLSRSDGKRPDGLTLVPWSAGKSIIWDVTVVDTLAASYIQTTSKSAGSVTEIAVTRKEDIYALPSPLKIHAKRLSYSYAYPLPCSDSMSFVFVTAVQFK